MSFVVAYDGDHDCAIEYWPESWVNENNEDWLEEVEGWEEEGVTFLLQNLPMHMAPVTIRGKAFACLGLYMTESEPRYGIYGNHLMKKYFVCDADKVIHSTNSWGKAIKYIKELTKNVSR